MDKDEQRDLVLKEILSLKNNNILAELPTGYGKSKIAIELMKKRKAKRVLIVIPKNVLISNWKVEMDKWYPNSKADIKFSTYVSIPKNKGTWDMVIFDEGHRLSDRCREALCDYNIKYSIILSATVSSNFKDELREVFDNLYCYKIGTKEAIESNVLPDPKVILLPLTLESKLTTEEMIINPKAKGREVNIPYKGLWAAKRTKNVRFKVYMTQRQYYEEISGLIEWYKKKRYLGYMKNRWLHACGERLKWLSDKKVAYTQRILSKLIDVRTLTFCGSIEQTELLGEYCINSKNKESQKIIDLFNNRKINHITAASMLDEGINLAECKVGIYNNLNSSERIIKQRLGRILRHKEPVVIIPYFKNTREEELVRVMLEDYNPNLVSVVNFIEEIDI